MKRTLKIIALALAFALWAVPSFAALNPKLISAPTERAPIAEFTQLFVSRIPDFEELTAREYKMNFNSKPAYNINGALLVNTAAGPAYINAEDLTVTMVSSTIFSYDDVSSLGSDLASCVLMLSALEYDAEQDSLLSLSGSSPAYEAWMIYSDEISPRFEEAVASAKDDGSPFMVYSGNYDYYIAYNEVEIGGKTRTWISLDAKARE